MKYGKLCLILSLLISLLSFSHKSSAQENLLGGGVELAVPLGDLADIASLGFGISARNDMVLTDQLSFTAQSGLNFYLIQDDFKDFINSYIQFPLQIGLGYYPNGVGYGFFGGAKAGMHLNYYSTEEIETAAGTTGGVAETGYNWSAAGEVGYAIDGYYSIGLRYQYVGSGGDTSGTQFGGDAYSYVALTGIYYFN